MKALVELIGVITVVVVAIVLGVVLNGWMASCFYEWFVLTLFPTLPKIGVGGFIGLSAFIGLFTYQPDTMKEEYKKEGEHQLLSAFFIRLFTLLVGYILY